VRVWSFAPNATTTRTAFGIIESASSKARFSIGLVIAAGMAIGTLFTRFVLPMFYTFIAKNDAAMARDEPELDLRAHPAE
jgi:multidrug efflux pump